MAFNSETAAAAGRESSRRRWGDRPRRTHQIKISVSEDEHREIIHLAAYLKTSTAEAIVRAVRGTLPNVPIIDCQNCNITDCPYFLR